MKRNILLILTSIVFVIASQAQNPEKNIRTINVDFSKEKGILKTRV